MSIIKALNPYSNEFSKSFKQGKFIPKNRLKYDGDVKNIIYRSSLELQFCNFCDQNSNIVKWSSECLEIPYMSPMDNKKHTYFPDFEIFIKVDNKIERWIIEVKPKSMLEEPQKPKSNNSKALKNYNFRLKSYILNMIKLKASTEYCIRNNAKYKLVTESFFGK